MRTKPKLTVRDEIPRHRKRRGKRVKRPFKLERRYVGPSRQGFLAWYYNCDWHVCGAYETERAIDDALKTASSKGLSFGGRGWEYRKAEIDRKD